MKMKYVAEFPEEFHYYVMRECSETEELVQVYYTKDALLLNIRNMVGDMVVNGEDYSLISRFIKEIKIYEIGKELNISHSMVLSVDDIEP
mgnify:CR=1 FL=1